tara:strand:+ start:88 stop:678 length:591 start_codon:yes stop_codon:yes gene_type:complete
MNTVDFVKEYPNIFPFKVVVSLLKYLNKVKFKKAEVVDPTNTTGASFQDDTRKAEVFDIFHNSKSYTEVHYFNLMRKTFMFMVQKYMRSINKSPANSPIEQLLQITALKYEKTGFYVPHCDHCGSIPRTVSLVYLLNNDYKGGELVFVNPTDNNQVLKKIDVQPNKLIIFPSNFIYPHSVLPVTDGTRYSVVSWFL